MLYFVVVLLVALGAPACSYSARPGRSAIKVQGELVVVDLHEAGKEWAIRKKDGTLQLLARNLQPNKDRKGRPLQPGATVRLDCVLDAYGACTSASPSAFTLKQEATVALAANNMEPVRQRLLAMILDFSYNGGPKPSLNESQVRRIILGPANDGSGGIAQKYSQCSYGLFGINATAFKAITVTPNISKNATSGCSWYTFSTTADAAAIEAIGNDTFRSFSHYMYILPPGLESICGWAGLALLPGKKTWLQTSSYGIHRWATVMQESLHSYGLWHSWQGGREYEDYSTSMGRGDACPNAAEISRLGWAIPAIGGDALNRITLLPGKALTFKLPATYLTGTGNYLRVKPDWLPVYDNHTLGKNLYIAVRVAKGADATISAAYAGRINIHDVIAHTDNAYPLAYQYIDRKIAFNATVPPLTRQVLSPYKLVVYGGSWSANDTLAVHLCRYDVADTECPGLDSLENLAPKSPSPLQRPPSPPQPSSSPKPPPPSPPPTPSPPPHPSPPLRPSSPRSPRAPRPPSPPPPPRPPPSPPKARPPPSPPKARPPPSPPKSKPPTSLV